MPLAFLSEFEHRCSVFLQAQGHADAAHDMSHISRVVK